MSQPPNTRSSRPASGTTSLIFGERPSVRLPSRIVPIWVSDPIGAESPLRIAMTPAIVVVLTAPRPTSRTPSLPRAGAISIGVGTNGNYIIWRRMFLNPFTKRDGDPHVLAVSMTDVKQLPYAAADFDLVVIDDTGALLEELGDADRAAVVREAARVLRAGGRV